MIEDNGSGRSPSTDTRTGLSSVVLAALGDMSLPVEVRVGSATITLHELLDCAPGTVLELNTCVGDLVELFVGGQLVAHGELVAIDAQLGLRIVEIVAEGRPDEC